MSRQLEYRIFDDETYFPDANWEGGVGVLGGRAGISRTFHHSLNKTVTISKIKYQHFKGSSAGNWYMRKMFI